MSSSHEMSSPDKVEKQVEEPAEDEQIYEEPIEKVMARPSQYLTVFNIPNPINPQTKKPRGSFNYNNIQRPQMAVDRMDSIRSMKNKMYMDPFMRTNQALLKRLDSIGSVFNKTSNNAHAKIALNETPR